MRTFQRTAFLIGATVTAAVLLADLLGLFRWMEDWTVDIRLRDARWQDEPPGDQLRLVGIDDASIDNVGRWPWPRERIADALDEVARAGARVAVFDVLFLEPETGSTGDERLAAAMRANGLKTVVALNVLQDKQLGPEWQSSGGRGALEALAAAAQDGIDRPMDAIVQQAGLREPWRSRVLDRPGAFKSLAAWLVLQRELREGRFPGREAFVRMMLGGRPDAAQMGEFAERTLLNRVWERGDSWRQIAPKLHADATVRGSPEDLPPIPRFAEAGALFGVVNAEPDRFDGRLRRITPMFATDFGWAPQLGVAAALAHQGLDASQAVVDGRWLRVGEQAFELQRDKLTLDWPTRLLNGFGRWQGDPLAVVRIGRLVEMADMRRRVEGQRARLRELAHDVVFTGNVLPERLRTDFAGSFDGGAVAREIREFWNSDYHEVWDTRDAKEADGRPKWGAEELKVASGMKEFLALEPLLADGEAQVRQNEAAFHDILAGKLVFFGFIATGTMADMVGTIFDPRTPGVFSHVAVADMLLNARSLRFVPAWISPVAVLVLGLTAAVVAARFGAGAGFAALMALLAGYAGALGVVGFDRFDVVYPMAAPVSAGLGSWVFATAGVAIVDRREKQRIAKQFRARVSSQLVDLLSENPKALSMEGVERETTILFGDLAGFTTISEKLGGAEVVKTLNLYMGAMTRELTVEHAYVNKFLGDGLLAFWSAFAPEPRQREYAVKAALNCQRLVTEIGARPDRAGLPPITLRLGIATGKVVIGDCGAPPDLNDYTVIGDAVNLASRLESANKQFGTRILVDGRTAEGAREAGLPLCHLGRVVVVGQSVPVEVAEVCLEADPTERIRMTEEAVQAFARADFDQARRAFAALEARFGASKTAHAFLEAMDNPEDRRDGVLRLRAK